MRARSLSWIVLALAAVGLCAADAVSNPPLQVESRFEYPIRVDRTKLPALEIAPGDCCKIFQADSGSEVRCCWNPTGEQVLVDAGDKTLILVPDTGANWKVERDLQPKLPLKDPVWSLDGRHVALLSEYEVRSFDLQTLVDGAPKERFLDNNLSYVENGEKKYKRRPTVAFAYSPDWLRMALGHPDRVSVYDFTHLRFSTYIDEPKMTTLRWAGRDSRTLVGASEQVVRLWKTTDDSSECTGTLLLDSKLRAMEVSPDGMVVAALLPENVLLWNLIDNTTMSLKGGQMTAMAWDPHSRLLATTDGKQVTLWDSFSGEKLAAPIELASGVTSLAFRPNTAKNQATHLALADKQGGLWLTELTNRLETHGSER